MSDTIPWVILIFVGAGAVRGAVGFGDALFAMPLLAMILPLRTATPLMAVIALFAAIVIVVRDWRHVEIKSAAVLTISGMVGIPVGIRMIRVVDESVVLIILGTVLIGFAGWKMRVRESDFQINRKLAPLFGLMAGILGGAYNTSGPPLVIYGTLRRWELSRFRAMLQTYCIVGSVWALSWHGIEGNLRREVFVFAAWSLPPVIVTTMIAQRTTEGMDRQRFVKLVYWLLIVLGVGLLWNALAGRGSPESMQDQTVNLKTNHASQHPA